ncbi:hypothetical protein QWT69_13010 [Sporosarcina oncorhynchi]|uniref:Uncharacterized protein n=1 Tax=Sporosarcina oncorhynchi TaxID=3056444 RepID=A0ABZ0L2E1_9BACL|nr:hypothetical protein [Sporosarcina sp. T2O-4]WOV86785.1 hypothetical protein QWT69_13010 [Sporosarcina sp. T2O-4]
MKKQWNFIMENKLITVFSKTKKTAEQEARKIHKELKQEVL